MNDLFIHLGFAARFKVVKLAWAWRGQGFRPDEAMAHPRWGDSVFLQRATQ